MNSLNVAVVLMALIASSQAIGIWNPAAHIPSGSVSVGVNGAVVAGPAGSVRTDNGIHGHGAGAQLSGPAGDVRTRGGAVALDGPGIGHGGVGVVGPVGIVGVRGIGIGPVGIVGPVGIGHGGIGGVGIGGIGGVGIGGIGIGGIGHW